MKMLPDVSSIFGRTWKETQRVRAVMPLTLLLPFTNYFSSLSVLSFTPKFLHSFPQAPWRPLPPAHICPCFPPLAAFHIPSFFSVCSQIICSSFQSHSHLHISSFVFISSLLWLGPSKGCKVHHLPGQVQMDNSSGAKAEFSPLCGEEVKR